MERVHACCQVGTVVWARMNRQPWWPARVTEILPKGRVMVYFFGTHDHSPIVAAPPSLDIFDLATSGTDARFNIKRTSFLAAVEEARDALEPPKPKAPKAKAKAKAEVAPKPEVKRAKPPEAEATGHAASRPASQRPQRAKREPTHGFDSDDDEKRAPAKRVRVKLASAGVHTVTCASWRGQTSGGWGRPEESVPAAPAGTKKRSVPALHQLNSRSELPPIRNPKPSEIETYGFSEGDQELCREPRTRSSPLRSSPSSRHPSPVPHQPLLRTSRGGQWLSCCPKS